MKHTRTRLIAAAGLATLTVLAVTGCTSNSSTSTDASGKPAASASADSAEPGESGFTNSSELPESWPSDVPGVDGFTLVGTYDKLAPATGAEHTATWQAEDDQFDLLKEHIDALEKAGWKVTGEFQSDPDAKTPSVTYTLTKGDWIVAYTGTMSGPNTVVNQMLIPVKPADKPAQPSEQASSKSDKGANASASAKPSPSKSK